MEIPGVGPLLASAFVATVADPAIFRSGRNLAAWIGLVPRQNSSGGKERLGGISKAGNRYPRQMLIVGTMAVVRHAGLAELGAPVVCIESRQAYQALKTLATHKTDRNDARGLAQLARTGFFKPVHIKSLPAHAVRALIMARKKLSASGSRLRTKSVGWRLCSGSGGHAVSVAFVEQVLAMSDGFSHSLGRLPTGSYRESSGDS